MIETTPELDVTIHDQMFLAVQKTIFMVGEFAGSLFYPRFVGAGRASGEMDATSLELHDVEQIESDQSMPGPDFNRVKSIAARTSQCDFRNVAHEPVRLRSGAGSIPWDWRRWCR